MDSAHGDQVPYETTLHDITAVFDAAVATNQFYDVRVYDASDDDWIEEIMEWSSNWMELL